MSLILSNNIINYCIFKTIAWCNTITKPCILDSSH